MKTNNVNIHFSLDDAFKQDWFLHNKTLIYIKDPLSFSININQVIKSIEEAIPEHMLDNLDDIFIGNFIELKKRNLEILYRDGALYVSSEFQSSNDSLTYCILLGIGYSIAKTYKDHFLLDQTLSLEFLKKRIKLCEALRFYIEKIKVLNMTEMLDESKNYDRLESLISKMNDKNIKHIPILELMKELFVTNFAAYSLENYIIDGYIEMLYQQSATKIEVFQNKCPRLYTKLYSLFYSPENKK